MVEVALCNAFVNAGSVSPFTSSHDPVENWALRSNSGTLNHRQGGATIPEPRERFLHMIFGRRFVAHQSMRVGTAEARNDPHILLNSA